MRLSELANSLQGSKIHYKNEDYEREIQSITADSRRVKASSLFFCLTGGERDGAAFAEEAVRAGAVAIVSERELPLDIPQILVEDSREAMGILSAAFYHSPSQYVKVIGVTGTNGKTTTTYMLESIFQAAGKKVGVIGTLGVRYGKKRMPSALTTPDPIELQATLAQMRKEGIEYVIMEVSAHALYYRKVAGIDFQACIFTNFTRDHLDFFHTMSAYKAAKLRLFGGACPLAIVNGDDEVGREIWQNRQSAGLKTTSYGLNTPVDGFAILTDESLYGSECMLNINDALCRVTLNMTGRHNVYNALAAATCAMELGVPVEAVSAGLSAIQGVTGRLQRISQRSKGDIYIDFAHTPDGLKQSLQALKGYCKGRLICLFGCGGNRDKEKRPIMGETVAKLADFAVLTSDNPRYEDPLDIIAEIEKGYRRFSSHYVIVPDRRRAIGYALEYLRTGDILLIAGKGGEEYQEIMGIKYPFNDHDIVIQLLRERGKNSL